MFVKIIPRETNKLSFLLKHLIHYQKNGTFIALPTQVYKIVKKTQNYAQFIPWCSRSAIIQKKSDFQNQTELTITFNNLKQLSYLSHVKIYGENDSSKFYRIQSICNDNPLKKLVSIWDIYKDPLNDSNSDKILTKVHYQIQYEFASPLLQMTSHLFLNYVGESMWNIFKQQAEKSQQLINERKRKQILDEKVRQQTKIRVNSQKKVSNLIEFLNKNQNIHNEYNKNHQFKQKVDEWDQLIKSTSDYEQKLLFKINNYLIYHPFRS